MGAPNAPKAASF